MSDTALRNGIFLAPFHPVDEDPTLALRRDLELIEFLDRIGYEEAWIGEHRWQTTRSSPSSSRRRRSARGGSSWGRA